MISMKLKIKKRHIAAAAANLLFLSCFAVFSLIGSSQAADQQYNYAADRWSGDDDYAQISCYMAKSAGFTTDSIGAVRSGLLSSLQTISVAPEDGQKLCPDAYSASAGQATVKGDISGSSQAEITAVGGDFFMIHDFKLLDGAYFSDDDLMQDGAVIDKNLAWALYGSCEVSGMNITVNGTQFYISGVIDEPQTKEERKCAGELPRAYISYGGASGFFGGNSQFGDADYGGVDGSGDFSSDTSFKTVTCYEVLIPDPVEGFAYSSVEKIMESYGDNTAVVQNNGRFNAFKRLGALKQISYSTVRSNEISYPYWENASRITEFRLSYIYLTAAICLVIPLITVIWLIIIGFKALKRNKKRVFGVASGFAEAIAKRARQMRKEKR